MYPLWNTIVEPAIRAAGARRVVEIGALRGDTTVRLLDALGPESEVHVIDPVPMFDPSEHARRFPGRYVFYRDLSHRALPSVPPCDVALVDGDHNWFTVYHELRLLAETARAAGRPLPLLILHDVGWPYGRRDLYYAPEQIPAEARQPYDRRGMVPGREELAPTGGLNPQLANAVREGGPRNGVMTALDDFIAEHDGALRRVVVPIYYGLALVADEALLAERPELAAFLDRLETPEARYEQLELVERVRVTEQVNHHNVHFTAQGRAERAAARYLELLKGALLNEHYLEHELRIGHLVKSIAEGREASPHKLGDPARFMAAELRELRQLRRAGDVAATDTELAYTGVGRTRLDRLQACLDIVRSEAVAGDLVECGTGRGGTGVFLRGYVEAHELPRPRVWVADRFGGGGEPQQNGEPRFPPTLNMVREAFDRFGLLDDRVAFLPGEPAETLAAAPADRIALARVDERDPAALRAVLEAIHDRVTLGGFVIVEGYDDPDCRAAVDAFRAEHGVADPLERIDWTGALWRRTAADPAADAPPARPARPAATKDLSVIVVVHDMRREAARTLHSLSRAYQRGIEDLDYEVIVVENGSSPDRRLGEEAVRAFGPEFTYVDMGADAHPSPAGAVNRGIEQACGRALALMIDGAHVLTPGVLRFAMLGLRAHAPAVVTTQQWYVGPGQQPDMVAKGYGAEYEDRLFEQIAWPRDGYKLFEIGHFIGDRDWFDGQWESNCIFFPRTLLEQAGGLDEGFDMAGGGFVNLDVYERTASSPGVTLVSILGEGSFHQTHGGTTTNAPDVGERRAKIAAYGEHYAQRRGRAYQGPGKPFHYVGSLTPAARRTRPRRIGASAFFRAAGADGPDARPEAVPVPQELRDEFVEAFWRSREWQSTTWLGRWTAKPATDLLVYQDLLFRVRPDWIVETSPGGGGLSFFLATVCDLLGHGRVLAVGDEPVPRLAEHDRIDYLRRDPLAEETEAELRAAVGERPRGLLLLGPADVGRLTAFAERYKDLVPVESYVVLQSTIYNGHPVWPGFGNGPWEAARELLRTGEFEPDPWPERYALTFNPGGFLRRVR